jgi:molybdate transport system regulatory protein
MSIAPTKAATARKRSIKVPSRSSVGAELRLRVDFGAFGAIGPGKVRLLELIGEHGSIATAGRAMRMSYRRAWLLVENLNRSFRQPLVTTQRGGSTGGGAALTAFGRDVVARYRAIEARATKAAAKELRTLTLALADKPPAELSVPPKRRG